MTWKHLLIDLSIYAGIIVFCFVSFARLNAKMDIRNVLYVIIALAAFGMIAATLSYGAYEKGLLR